MSPAPVSIGSKGVKYAAIALVAVIVLRAIWPFYSVPTGSRGVVTQFGRIVGIENEGLAVLPPWQKLANFSIRAEQANIDNAGGSTSDTQPVSVSLTVRYMYKINIYDSGATPCRVPSSESMIPADQGR
jgi:regulator of protease activity HflC (stomatin/prohibitin superfamily)